ncbi:MAG: twin-arginine translocase subunit TatC [Candidatus Eisenbacteria bacterium]
MPFWEHLEELRRVLLRSIAFLLVATIVAYFLSGRILDKVVADTVGEAIFLKPMEAFNARLKIAFLIGLLVALPLILSQIWSFVVPGLLQKERKTIAPLAAGSTLLFYAGVAFSYLVLTPTMLHLLTGFASARVQAQISVGSLLEFLVTMAVVTGILFQLPLVVAILSMIGVLSPTFLTKRWRQAVVGIFILTAVVTPGDGPSQIVLAAPVLVLYVLSIFVARIIWGRKRRAEAARSGGGDAGEEGGSDGGA